MPTRKGRLVSFLAEDRGLSAMLLVMAIAAFVAAPLAQAARVGEVLVSVAVSLMFVCGAFAVAPRRRTAIATAIFAALSIGLEWGGNLSGARGLQATSAAAGCCFASLLVALLLIRVFQDGPITVHRLLGAIAVYLLLGFAFGEAARCIATLDPEAYRSALQPTIDRAEVYYFSVITLTTVGYGDITPVHPMARSLAALEALSGQMFLAILLGRLVSQEMASRAARRD